MQLLDPFTRHPASVGETYGQHLVSAGGFALRLLGAALACLVHAILPFLFVRTGSAMVTRLYDAMVAHRARRSPAPVEKPARASLA